MLCVLDEKPVDIERESLREEARHIGFSNKRFARCDVIELTVEHPTLEFADQIVEMFERFDNEQQWLVVVDLEGLVDDAFEFQRIALDLV